MQIQILTFIIPIIALIFNVIFFAFWWGDKSRRYVLAYSACFGSMALGVLINIWIIGSFGAMGIISYHVFSMAGVLALMWGTAARNGQKAPLLVSAATVVITCVVLWAAMEAGSQDAARQAQNTNSALLIAIIAINLWHTSGRHWSDRSLIWVLVALSGFGFLRPFLTMLSDYIFGTGEAAAALLTSLHVLILAVLLTLMALSLIATIAFDDVRERKHEAAIDSLSGLRARGAFETEAKLMIDRANARNKPLCLIVADIDHFKAVNDAFGHLAGDRVIQAFGRQIEALVRRGDVAGRIGGEEFCALIWDCTLDDAAHLAERIRQAAARQGRSEGDEISPYTVSFGVAEWRSADTYKAVFERADSALYRAKDAGRNKVFTESGAFQDGGGSVVPFASRMSQRHGLGAG